MEIKGRILGLDYGDKRIGVAVTDPSRIIASAKEVILNKSNDFVLDRIKELILEMKIEELLLGVPYSLEGDETPQTKKVLKFGDFLKDELELPIIFFDEAMSTMKANQILSQQGRSRKKKKGDKDMVSAQVMLLEYIN